MFLVDLGRVGDVWGRAAVSRQHQLKSSSAHSVFVICCVLRNSSFAIRARAIHSLVCFTCYLPHAVRPTWAWRRIRGLCLAFLSAIWPASGWRLVRVWMRRLLSQCAGLTTRFDWSSVYSPLDG